MTVAGIILLVIGAIIALTNAYLSFIRYPLHRARGGTRETYRGSSGIPLFGSLLLWLSIPLLPSNELRWLAVGLSLLDTGGPHWYLAIVLWPSR